MTDLDLAAIRSFVATVDEGQFSHAAVVLGLTQQAVSKRIAKLENQLGVSLFHRVPTGVIVTPAGRRLLPHARSLLALADEAITTVRDEPRPLRVASQGARQAETQSMRFYLHRHPDRDVELVMSNLSVTARDALASGRVDAALARAHGGPQTMPFEIGAAAAYLEPLHIFVGKDHPLAAHTVVRLAELTAYPAWVPGACVPSEWADYYRCLSEFSGITVETGDRPDPMENIMETLVASRSYYTFSGEGYLAPWHPHIRRIPVVDPTPAYPHALLWSTANPHPGLPHLIDYVRAHYNRDIVVDHWFPEVDRTLFGC
ncbi:LysR family transcriptional regulator [Nocardia terpenica]|uniref:LysR family transcriptional regulator n=1 Tax=Nocardia terpenica TaxID=455432 RepID=UPI002FE27D02